MRLFPCLWRRRRVRPWRLAFGTESELERELYCRDLRGSGAPAAK